MKIFLFGSIAFDEIGQFKGHFREVIKPEMMENLTVSFLVENNHSHFGGCSGNTAYGLGFLKTPAYLCSRIGTDGASYEKAFLDWGMHLDFLERGQGPTAKAVVTTDLTGAQIAHFATGVIGENAPDFVLPSAAEAGDLILVGPENPKRMLQALEQGHARGLKVFFDPGQLIHTFSADALQSILGKIHALLVNEYEWALFKSISGLEESEIFQKVPLVWITKGAEGVAMIENGKSQNFPAFTAQVADPTGAGDAFRAGLLAGIAKGMSLEDSTKAGIVLAAACCEHHLAQGYSLKDPQVAVLRTLGFA